VGGLVNLQQLKTETVKTGTICHLKQLKPHNLGTLRASTLSKHSTTSSQPKNLLFVLVAQGQCSALLDVFQLKNKVQM